jgi:predicted metal-dependent phosphoesterase TrpH
MTKIDFHTHTHHSYDCRMEPLKILQLAKQRGLNAIVINDHDTVKGGLEAQAKNPYSDLKVIVGAEIKTDVGDITGIFLKEEITSRKHTDVIQEIKNQGGLVILNHPYIQHKLSEINYSGIDFIEGYNGRTDRMRNELAIELAAKEKKPILAGSDAHTYSEIANCYSIFPNFADGVIGTATDHQYKRSPFLAIEKSKLIKASKKQDYKLSLRIWASMPISLIKYYRS